MNMNVYKRNSKTVSNISEYADFIFFSSLSSYPLTLVTNHRIEHDVGAMLSTPKIYFSIINTLKKRNNRERKK